MGKSSQVQTRDAFFFSIGTKKLDGRQKSMATATMSNCEHSEGCRSPRGRSGKNRSGTSLQNNPNSGYESKHALIRSTNPD
jgi:hypothetical protein